VHHTSSPFSSIVRLTVLAAERLALAALGWEGGFAVETGKKPNARKMLENARSTHRQLHTVLGGFRI